MALVLLLLGVQDHFTDHLVDLLVLVKLGKGPAVVTGQALDVADDGPPFSSGLLVGVKHYGNYEIGIQIY